MAVILTEDQRQSPLYKYYELPIAPVPQERINEIMQMTDERICVVTCQDLNMLFDSDSYEDEYGIFHCPDGGMLLSNVTAMPNVTPEMFDWWFAWHGLDTMRYIIWDKDDHYYCKTRNPDKALDSKLTLKERYWDTIHDVKEALLDGDDPIPVFIPFVSPNKLGFSAEKMEHFPGTIVCTSGPVIMIHFLQPITESSVQGTVPRKDTASGISHSESHVSGVGHLDSHASGASHAESRASGADHTESRVPEASHAESHAPGAGHAEGCASGADHAESYAPGEGIQKGCILRTRFYLGYQVTEQGNVRIQDYHAPVELARAMLVHNIKEYTHLARILPDLYNEFKDQW